MNEPLTPSTVTARDLALAYAALEYRPPAPLKRHLPPTTSHDLATLLDHSRKTDIHLVAMGYSLPAEGGTARIRALLACLDTLERAGGRGGDETTDEEWGKFLANPDRDVRLCAQLSMARAYEKRQARRRRWAFLVRPGRRLKDLLARVRRRA